MKNTEAYEKVNPSHPDKVADRIAGAMVDRAYEMQENPRIAVEVLIGHGEAKVIAETSVHFTEAEVGEIIHRISGIKDPIWLSYREVPQDAHLAKNQAKHLRCGDNGIFKGVPVSASEARLARIAARLYERFPADGKFITDNELRLIICQSNATEEEIRSALELQGISADKVRGVNPLGYWTGGTGVDSGATNRKLGSDMGRAVTGGGLHGKDLSKADVSVNIACHILAQQWQKETRAFCAIGDDGIIISTDEDHTLFKYEEIVEMAKKYIDGLGGFEKLAEWGLIHE